MLTTCTSLREGLASYLVSKSMAPLVPYPSIAREHRESEKSNEKIASKAVIYLHAVIRVYTMLPNCRASQIAAYDNSNSYHNEVRHRTLVDQSLRNCVRVFGWGRATM
jgi:hypothetical protein